MNRPLLSPDQIESEALKCMANFHAEVVKEVISAVSSNKVVVVGMAHNPFVRKARQALTAAGVEFKYLQYGNYLSGWKSRLAIKLWSGWPTYPQVFVNGKLMGGFQETKKALDAGKIKV